MKVEDNFAVVVKIVSLLSHPKESMNEVIMID